VVGPGVAVSLQPLVVVVVEVFRVSSDGHRKFWTDRTHDGPGCRV
jgi:hypothetical protein